MKFATLIFGTVTLLGCSKSTEPSACPDSMDGTHGTFLDGQEVVMGTAVPVPFNISVYATSDFPIEMVYAGDKDGYYVPGTLTSLQAGRWQIQLFPSQIEHFRSPGTFMARIPVNILDSCGQVTPVGDSTLALGPAPGVVVSGLMITPDPDLATCYVPPDGSVSPRFKISADPTATGGIITVSSTHGTWTNGSPTMMLPLAADTSEGSNAVAHASFVPSSVGTADLYAFAGGASSDVFQLVVAAPPSVVVSNTSPARGTASWLDFYTTGNFDTCSVEESVSHTTSVIREGAGTGSGSGSGSAVDGSISVNGSPDCRDAESVRLAVTFLDNAPDGSKVTVRCDETNYGRFASSTLTVAPLSSPPDVPVTNLQIALAAPLSDCYLPADGSITPVFLATADASSVGGSITVFSTHGTWSNGNPQQNLTLASGASRAEARTTFTPTGPGVAQISAQANGVLSNNTVELLLAAPPTVTATSTTPARGTTAWLDFATAGNFDSCTAEESVTGAATATVVDPPVGNVTGTVSVRQTPQDCSTPESVRIAVTFASTAPNGASVTVRCRETSYGRSAAATLTVASQ